MIKLLARARGGRIVDTTSPGEKAIRAARVAAARRLGWEELPETRLIPRGPRGWLVDAETDAVYVPYRGATFERGSARLVAIPTTLSYYVDDDGSPVVLERQPQTWSQIFAGQVRR